MKRAIFSKCSKADYRGMKALITMKPIKSKSLCSNCSKNTKIGYVGSTSGPEWPVKVNSPKLKICQKKVFSANQEPGKNLRINFEILHNHSLKTWKHFYMIVHEYDSWIRLNWNHHFWFILKWCPFMDSNLWLISLTHTHDSYPWIIPMTHKPLFFSHSRKIEIEWTWKFVIVKLE